MPLHSDQPPRGRRGLRLHSLADALKQTTMSWLEHEGPRLAASLSFYSLLSLAPLVILTIAFASLAFGRSEAEQVLIDEVRDLMGGAGASTVEVVIEHGTEPRAGGVASLIGIIILLLGASSVFGELQSGLNKIWNVKAPDDTGLLSLRLTMAPPSTKRQNNSILTEVSRAAAIHCSNAQVLTPAPRRLTVYSVHPTTESRAVGKSAGANLQE